MLEENHQNINFLGDLQRLELKDGDRFILTCDYFISMQQRDEIIKAWQEFIGNTEKAKLLILDGGSKIEVVSAEEAA